jgi:hypothetical protein
LETRLCSGEHLVRALRALGYGGAQLFAHAQALAGLGASMHEARAEVIIRRAELPGASTDIGFRRTGEGRFEAVIYDMDRPHYGAPWLRKVTQRYAYEVARDKLEAQGFELVDEEVDAGETIRLTLRRMA